MLTLTDLSLLHRLVADCRDWSVLDWRDPRRPALYRAFDRAWAPGGLVLRPGPMPTLDDPGSPIVLTAEAPLPAPWAERLAGTIHVQERDGRLFHGTRPLDDLDAPALCAGSTTLTLRAREDVTRHRIDLPQGFRVRGCAVPSRNVLGVDGDNPRAALPPPRWFQVPRAGVAEVEVDVRPGVDGDRWEVRIDGKPASPAPPPAPTRPHLDHLGLVFDRTCPDAERWGDARLLLVDPYRYLEEGAPLAPGDFNRGLRQGLARALAARPDASAMRVEVVWFADVPGEDVARVEGLAFPQRPAGTQGTRSADQVEALLDTCHYCPGLDLWDPLQDALKLAADPLLARPRPGAGILIVGNSPPDLPLADGPFLDLLDFRDHGSTVRRRSRLFTDVTRALDDQAIPVVYLFLTHDRCTRDEETALHLHQALQEQVRAALAKSLHVVTAPADAGGVARGLQEALAYLASPPASAVVVLERGLLSAPRPLP